MMRFVFVLLAAMACSPAQAVVYDIDAVHSSVGFKVRHMVVAKTSGNFRKFSGTIHYDPKTPQSWKTEAVIEAASIDTGNEKRDGHLKNADFFDVEKYPTLEFKSTKIKTIKGNKAQLHGTLTMHGVTKKIVLDLEIHGAAGGRAGFTATGTLDRTDYGVSWNRVVETGGLAVGKEVEIILEIEAHEQKKK